MHKIQHVNFFHFFKVQGFEHYVTSPVARTAGEWASLIRECNVLPGEPSVREAMTRATLQSGGTPSFGTVYCFAQELSRDDALAVLTSAVEAFSGGEYPAFITLLGGPGSRFYHFCRRIVSGHFKLLLTCPVLHVGVEQQDDPSFAPLCRSR